ncbi:MAG TPA: hypothetical protein VN934_06435 [Candidatus Tumulicola sp.]|nr:hypothetical protein [Candidatus Tumulicola sp.]
MALSFVRSRSVYKAFLVLALVFSMLAGTMSQTRADSAAVTRNLILGAAAVAAGIIIYNNYQHKVAQANTVVGYTRDGGVIYGDGRVVYPNSGNVTTYLSNNGSQPCTFNGYGTRCAPTHLTAYFPQGYRPACWPPGHCKQYWKQHQGKGNQGHGKQDKGNQGNGNGGHGN